MPGSRAAGSISDNAALRPIAARGARKNGALMQSHPDAPRGSFAEGEETLPPEDHAGSFAEGEETLPPEDHVGSFAEGEETLPPDRTVGSFAEKLE